MSILAGILDTSFFDPILESPGVSGVVVGLVAIVLFILKQLLWPKKTMIEKQRDEDDSEDI